VSDQQKAADAVAEMLGAGHDIHAIAIEMAFEVLHLRRLLDAIVEDSDCRFDHHGGCQEHGFLWLEQGEVCPNHEARELLSRTQQGEGK